MVPRQTSCGKEDGKVVGLGTEVYRVKYVEVGCRDQTGEGGIVELIRVMTTRHI